MIAETALSSAISGSLLSRWEARLKLPGLLILIFSFAIVQDLRLLVPLVVTAAFIYFLSGLPLKYLLHRLKLPGFFLLVLAIILPFWSGQTVLWQFGPLALRLEGLLGLLLIAIKFIGILTVAVALFATTPLAQVTVALRSLGIPWLLTDLLLFTYRFIFQLARDLQRMRTAARLRGFVGSSLFSLKTLANITGSMLVRSHAQSERVFQAMTLRGYGNASLPLPAFQPVLSDFLLLSFALLLATGFVLAQYLL